MAAYTQDLLDIEAIIFDLKYTTSGSPSGDLIHLSIAQQCRLACHGSVGQEWQRRKTNEQLLHNFLAFDKIQLH
jgi:hypothetical protein